MQITKLSNDFTPLSEGVFFAIESDEPQDLVVEICDADRNEVIATQKVTNTSYTKVNIAPYIAQTEMREPSTSLQSEIREWPVRHFYLRCNGSDSESIAIAENRCQVGDKTVLTSLPHHRQMGRHDHDEVVVMCKPNEEVVAVINTDYGEELFLDMVTESGVAIINISPIDFAPETKHLEVVVTCNNLTLTTLNYDIVPTYKGVTRLAWMAESGSIERYSFPASQRSQRSVEKVHFHTKEGVCAVHGESKNLLTLRSRYESRAMVEALIGVASSPRVWIEQNGSLQSVEVESNTLEYNIFNEPSAIILTLCTEREEVSL
jgi:hypothetical protein